MTSGKLLIAFANIPWEEALILGLCISRAYTEMIFEI